MTKLALNCTVEYLKQFLSKQESTQLYHSLIKDYNIRDLNLDVHANGMTNKTGTHKVMFMDQDLYASNKLP